MSESEEKERVDKLEIIRLLNLNEDELLKCREYQVKIDSITLARERTLAGIKLRESEIEMLKKGMEGK